MSTPLETYLIDHLTGSDAALDLLEKLGREHDGELGRFFDGLRREIEEERRQLQGLMERFGYERSTIRSAGARLAEKVGRLKLTGSDERGGALHLLEALDMLQSAIQGKRGLWRALGAAATIDPQLAVLDYGELAALASDQLDRLDAIRLQTAPAALAAPGPASH
jgi:hypothetical protein